MIETIGNQQYIFNTNKLRENIGGSELVHRATSQWVEEACGRSSGATASPMVTPSTIEDGAPVEVVIASSGKAVLLVDSAERGRDLVWEVTRRALHEAPGLGIVGVVSDGFDWASASLDREMTGAHALLAAARQRIPDQLTRFRTRPVTAPCATNPLPASTERNGDRLSAVADAKRRVADAGWTRMTSGWGSAAGARGLFARDLGALEQMASDDQVGWAAVIHADGNRLGRVFSHLGDWIPDDGHGQAASNRRYADTLRGLSVALDRASSEAFKSALSGLEPDTGAYPLVPIIVGGDDLTVVCRGSDAVGLAARFLRDFSRATANEAIIQQLVSPHGRRLERVTASAGVAVAKPHFPFHAAYDLAEALLASAKRSGAPEGAEADPGLSTLDFHVLYDGAPTDLASVRSRMVERREDRVWRLWGGPYTVESSPSLDPGERLLETDTLRSLAGLQPPVAALAAVDDRGRPVIPRAQVHRLRSTIRTAPQQAEAAFRQLRSTLDRANDLGETVFRVEPDESTQSTSLLDAMALVKIGASLDVAVDASS